MSPGVNRCGTHDQMVQNVGRLNACVDSLREGQVGNHASIEKLHERINSLKQCVMDLKFDTIRAVNKNNLKLVAIASPVSGAVVAIVTILAKHYFGG